MSRVGLLTILCILFSDLKVGWSGRTWQSNLNYNNPSNWSPGHVPCSSDKIVLRASEPLVLQLPEGQTSARELLLADYVELVLPKDGALQLTGVEHTATCNGQDAVFKHTRALRWTDPYNWNGWNKATPDLERVPCTMEDVKFRPGDTFNVITPPVLKVGGIEINGVVMDSYDWYDYSNNGDSVRQIHKLDGDPPEMMIRRNPCNDPMQCQCGNEYLHSEICKTACLLPFCKQPVKPSGFCCSLCGAYFLLRSDNKEVFQLTDHINSFLKDKGIIWHGSKVGQFIQIVLVEDGDYSGEIAEIADDLKTSLTKSGLGWSLEEFHTSGHVWYPTSFTQVAGNFLSLLVLAATTLSAIIVFYSKNWSWLHFSSSEGRPFVFARFENQSGELIVAHEPRQPAPCAPSQAFDNPMYGATSQQRNITVENPVYTELEDASGSCGAEEAIMLNSTDDFSK